MTIHPAHGALEELKRANALLNKADHLARMVCKMLREDLKGDAIPLSSGERRRLLKWATEWLETFHSANAQ